MIRAAGILQLLLGNIGRPGGGIMAMRGHASIQGSTDIPTLYDLLPGYMPQPAAIRDHDTLTDYLEAGGSAPRLLGQLAEVHGQPAQGVVRRRRARRRTTSASTGCRGSTATTPTLPTFIRMADGKVKGFFLFGQNPAAGAPNAGLHREALKQARLAGGARLVRNRERHASGTEGPDGPDPKTIKTEVFFLPAASSPEKDGHLHQYATPAAVARQGGRPAGRLPLRRCGSSVDLGQRLKELYAGSTRTRDQGLLNLTWDYDYDEPPVLPDGSRAGSPTSPMSEKSCKRSTATRSPIRRQVKGFADLKDDGTPRAAAGSTAASIPTTDHNRARERKRDARRVTSPNWGFAWPHNRRMMYNRASADPEGRPWSERKKYIWWDEAQQQVDRPGRAGLRAGQAAVIPAAAGRDGDGVDRR